MGLENELSRILIIDDEQVVLDSCTEILLDPAYDITTAQNGRSGLDVFDEYRPDLVLVDLKMPGLSGLEVLEEIGHRDPTVVSVVITGYATVDSAIDAMKRGAYDFIPKPFTPDQLRAVVRRAAEKRRLTLEAIALRRDKELLRENFAAIVSHELKSPLSAMQQNLFVLSQQLSSQVNVDQRRQLDRMKTRLGELLGMVDTWLRSVTVDLSEIRQRFGVVPLASVIAGAFESAGTHATRKNVELIAEEHGETVYGDEGTLTEALTNIVGNAVKYSHPGGSVTVVVKPLNGTVRIDVSDTGVGIAAEEQTRIFDDFYRANTGAHEGGAGLGLAVSKRILDVHRGSVSVESELGEGTTFVIRLPADAPQPELEGRDQEGTP